MNTHQRQWLAEELKDYFITNFRRLNGMKNQDVIVYANPHRDLYPIRVVQSNGDYVTYLVADISNFTLEEEDAQLLDSDDRIKLAREIGTGAAGYTWYDRDTAESTILTNAVFPRKAAKVPKASKPPKKQKE